MHGVGSNMHSNRPLISPCLDRLGQDNFRCRHTGVEFRTTVFPIHCCPNSPSLNTPEHLAAIKKKLTDQIHPMALDRDMKTIANQIDRCLGCERFNGRTCTARGKRCEQWNRWTEWLALAEEACAFFSDASQ